MRLSLGLLIAISSVSCQFDVSSAIDDALQQAEDMLNEFLEENPELDAFFNDGDYNDVFLEDDYGGDYNDYDDEYDEEYDEEYDGEDYEEEYGDDYYDYAGWYEDWVGTDWKDYWYDLMDVVYELVDWVTDEFGLDDEDWNNLFDYYYDGNVGF